MQLNVGDTIIMGSDGLWDNLHSKELLSLVNTHAKDG
jgi:serine/threonine protein phosphatase PrpC